MKKSYFVLSALALLLAWPKITLADPRFRRPLSISTTTITAFYDHQTGTGFKKYSCSTSGYYNTHTGTDFSAAIGTPIYAAAQGGLYFRFNQCPTIGSIGDACGGHYGNHVRIDHEGNMTDGLGWVTIYAHLKRDTAVYPMSLLCSAYIGQSGSSGDSSGGHLHFEVRKYTGLNNDPYSGSCSHTAPHWWTSVNNTGMPGTQCQ